MYAMCVLHIAHGVVHSRSIEVYGIDLIWLRCSPISGWDFNRIMISRVADRNKRPLLGIFLPYLLGDQHEHTQTENLHKEILQFTRTQIEFVRFTAYDPNGSLILEQIYVTKLHTNLYTQASRAP